MLEILLICKVKTIADEIAEIEMELSGLEKPTMNK